MKLESLALFLGIGCNEVPDYKILVDSHAHFHRNNDVVELVDIMLEKNVGIQAVCDYGANKEIDWVYSYRDFRNALRKSLGNEIRFSDDYATIIERRDKQLIITQGREVISVYDEESKGFLRNKHEVHLVVEGTQLDIPSGKTYETLDMATDLGGEITVAHPFTIPARFILYGYANEQEKGHLYKITTDFFVMFEGLNSTSALWMNRANKQVRDFADEINIPLIYNTDMHARQNIGLMKRQIGLAGTLIPKGSIHLDRIQSGRDIITMKNIAVAVYGESYGKVMDPILFAQIMFRAKLK